MTEPTDAAEKGWVADKARIVKTEKNGWCAFLDIEDEDGQRIGSINICRGINSHDAAAALVRNWVRDLSASLYTTPQPTQAQAGAVPLTDEQIKEVMDLVSDWGMQSHLRGEAELDAHNPEATEDEITYAKECAEKERAAWNAIKDKLKPHGIKGGQHGPA